MSGFVELVRGLRLDPAPARVAPLAASEIADDPADEIAARFAEVAAGAVHALELVAAIEAEGLTDRQIQQRYGRRDAFELGEELFRRAHPEAHSGARPRGHAKSPAQSHAKSHAGARRGPRARMSKRIRVRLGRGRARRFAAASAWGVSASRSALRGLLFALPGLAFVLAAPPRGSLWCAGAALLFSWSWSQAVAHLGYVRLGREERDAAAKVLAHGGALGAALCLPVAVVAALVTGASAATVAFALGQALYFGAATALLVLGCERALVGALVPVAFGAAWLLAARPLGLPGPPGPVGPTLVLLSLGLAVRAGWRETGGLTRLAWRFRWDAVRGGEWRGAALAGVFGLAVAVLTLARVGPTTVALTLSMGGAEWFLARCRGTTELALSRAGAAREFHGLVLGALARCLGGYLLLVAALAWIAQCVWPGASGPGIGPLAALAAAIWSAQLLQSLGLLTRATLGVCTAATGLLVLHGFGVPTGTAQATAGVVAAVALSTLAAAAVTTATRHR